MSFEHPALLPLLLLALPLAAWTLLRLERRRRSALENFGQPGLLARASAIPLGRLRLARHLTRLSALCLGIVALARPQLGERPASLVHTGRDLLVALDLSRSMNAADVEPPSSRLDVAKRAIIQAVAASPGDRVGLVVFGGGAFLQLPLTADHAAFRRFLDAASTDDLADPSTDLGRALATAATAFEHEGERGFQSVLLVSDGGSGEADLAGELGRLRKSSIPVFAIGVGTAEGAPIPADSSRGPELWHRDHVGRVVLSRLEEGDLRRAAQETGGRYVRWTPEAAPTLIAGLTGLEKRTMASRSSPEPADRFQWPLGLAIALLALDPLLAMAAVRRRA
ncbi:MAG: VWA domain-containing protein [Gemmatimonadales bacterium]